MTLERFLMAKKMKRKHKQKRKWLKRKLRMLKIDA
jgi:hypothetical protein